MKKLKNNKGVTLLTLTIAIIILLIITSITIYNAKSQLALKNVNNLYSDIDAISTKITAYYLQNNSLPVYDNAYLENTSQLQLLLKANGGSGYEINPNDNGSYYVINLSKLDNLTLNYGQEYKNWSNTSSYQTSQDLYIINKVSHQIYYPLGMHYRGKTYFSSKEESEEIEKIIPSTISTSGLYVSSIDVTKTINESKVILEANITLTISDDFKEDTLKYAWSLTDDSNIEFTEFSLADSKSAILTSKLLDDSTQYYLYIKILDINGDEHILKQSITST